MSMRECVFWTTVVRGRGQAPRETLAQQVGAPCSACASDRRAVARAVGQGVGLFPTLGIITSRVGGGGRQDKPSRCAWPRALSSRR